MSGTTDEYDSTIIDVYSNCPDLTTGYLGGETTVTDRGKYGWYNYVNEIGGEQTYRWASRTSDYGHRVFATFDECKRYVAGENI